MKLQLISNGDSWVFGSEIVDPDIIKTQPIDKHMGEYDWIEDNTPYRLSKIFTFKTTKLVFKNRVIKYINI